MNVTWEQVTTRLLQRQPSGSGGRQSHEWFAETPIGQNETKHNFKGR